MIIQGEDLEITTTVSFGDQEVPFDIDGKTLVVEVPDGSGTVEVTVEGADGTSDTSNVTIQES